MRHKENPENYKRRTARYVHKMDLKGKVKFQKWIDKDFLPILIKFIEENKI